MSNTIKREADRTGLLKTAGIVGASDDDDDVFEACRQVVLVDFCRGTEGIAKVGTCCRPFGEGEVTTCGDGTNANADGRKITNREILMVK
jgi:hypothetical protein